MPKKEVDNRGYLEWFWDELPTASESIAMVIPALGIMGTKIIEVESTNIADFACNTALEYIKQNPVTSAAALLTVAGLSYCAYSYATEDLESKKALQIQEGKMEENFKALTDFIDDISKVYRGDKRIEVSMQALKECHDDIVDDFKNGKAINPENIENIQWLYKEMLSGLQKGALEESARKSSEFVESVKLCGQMREDISNGKSFAARIEKENSQNGAYRGK